MKANFLFVYQDVSPELFENNNNIFIGDVESPRLYTPTSEHHTKEIILINGRDGKKLGFSMAGGAEYGSPLVVKNILAGGIASLDGRLRIGQCLLSLFMRLFGYFDVYLLQSKDSTIRSDL